MSWEEIMQFGTKRSTYSAAPKGTAIEDGWDHPDKLFAKESEAIRHGDTWAKPYVVRRCEVELLFDSAQEGSPQITLEELEREMERETTDYFVVQFLNGDAVWETLYKEDDYNDAIFQSDVHAKFFPKDQRRVIHIHIEEVPPRHHPVRHP